MISEVRGAFILLLAFVFFLIIIGALALGTAVMKPGRWSERPRLVG
jgi:hypothetical protein